MAFTPKASPSLLTGLYPQRQTDTAVSGLLRDLTQWLERRLWRSRHSVNRQKDSVQRLKNNKNTDDSFVKVLSVWTENHGTPCSDAVISAAQGLQINRALVELESAKDCQEASKIAALAMAATGIPVHLIYGNDPKDVDDILNVAEKLGLKACVLKDDETLQNRREAYESNIVLLSFRQLVFDYLLDERLFRKQKGALSTRLQHRVLGSNGPLLRGLACGIIVDGREVLIDHALRPVAISDGEGDPGSHVKSFYKEAINFAKELVLEKDYLWDESTNTPVLIEYGKHNLDSMTAGAGPLWRGKNRSKTSVCAALTAFRMSENVDYKITESQVSFVSPPKLDSTLSDFTDTDWKQLILAKHDLEPENSRPAISRRISLQHFFPRYIHLASAGWVLEPRRREIENVYGLLSVPLYSKKLWTHAQARRFKNSVMRKKSAEDLLKASVARQENVLMVSCSQQSMKDLHEFLGEKVTSTLLPVDSLGKQAEVGGLFYSVSVEEALAKIGNEGVLGEFHNVFFVDTPSGMLNEYLICAGLHTQREIVMLSSSDEELFSSCHKVLRMLMPFSSAAYRVMRKNIEFKERQARVQVAAHDAYVRQSLAFSVNNR